MLSGTIIAVVLSLNLALFFAINLQNLVKGSRERSGKKAHSEVERPSGILISLAALGTFAFFAEAILIIYLGIVGKIYLFMSIMQLEPPFSSILQVLGLAMVTSGILVFVWSVVARGRYSVSWEMPHDQLLVTWGPYRYVRHPSYLGYLLMFSGIFLVWLNIVALIPILGIPSYVALAKPEEELLISRFGQNYQEYMRSTGRFIPRVSSEREKKD
jgi:protein-S-isoprenylcysteine O-methyltransferase Ste14